MVETKIIAMRFRLVFLSFLISSLVLSAQDYEWRAIKIDGEITACTTPSKDNIEESIGKIKKPCGIYVSPSGKKFKKTSSTARVAKVVLNAQPKMARVKKVIAYSPEYMAKDYPESALSNWFVDVLMLGVEKVSGKNVDMGVANFGGIRVDMPKGNVILDDMLSMFPFKNQIVYLELLGSSIRKMLQDMAASKFQILGGLRVVVEDGKLVSAKIGGEPLVDDKFYSVATITFLLDGGDGLRIAQGARNIEIYDIDIIDIVLDFVYAEAAAGRPLTGKVDGRLIIR